MDGDSIPFDIYFKCTKSPSCILCQDTYQIVNVNESFNELIMSKSLVLNLNFFKDMIKESEKYLFQQSITDAKLNPNKMSDIQLYILIETNSVPTYEKYSWRMIIAGDYLFLQGEKISLPPTFTDLYDNKLAAIPTHAQLEDFLQKAPLAMHWLSGTGHIIWANDTELATLGYTREEYIGHSIMEFCPEEAEAVQEVFLKLSNGETVRNAPFKFRTKTGDAVYLRVDSNVSWHEDGSFNHTRCFIRNDTERKVKEAFNNAIRNKAETVAIAKNSFIRKVFHEIKTPLHECFQLFANNLINSNNNELISHVFAHLESCCLIVDDLAFASMFDEGNIVNPKPMMIMLHETISSIFNKLNPDVKWSITLPDSIPFGGVVGNNYLIRVLNILIKNAVNHTLPDGNISVVVTCQNFTSPDIPCDYTFQITNSVDLTRQLKMDVKSVHEHCQHYYAADIATMLKEEFDCSNNLSHTLTDTKGMGVGLYVAYSMVQILGGLLECSASDTSSSFWFKIPLHCSFSSGEITSVPSNGSNADYVDLIHINAAQNADYVDLIHINAAQKHLQNDFTTDSISKESIRSIGAKRKVLIVDDSPICRKVLVKCMETKNYDTDVACNGEEAFKLLQLCKQKSHLNHIPFVIITAEVGEDVKVAAREAKADYFMSKPANPSELFDILDRAIIL
eukprot:gene4408-6234_t